jgi:hypothetical protein
VLDLVEVLGVPHAALFVPSPQADDRRQVSVTDFEDLSATHKRLADVIARFEND